MREAPIRSIDRRAQGIRNISEAGAPGKPSAQVGQRGGNRLRIGRLGRLAGPNRGRRRHPLLHIIAKQVARLAPFRHRQGFKVAPFQEKLTHHRAHHFVRLLNGMPRETR